MVCRTELSLNQEREILAKQHGVEECACHFLEGLVCLYPGQENSGLSHQGLSSKAQPKCQRPEDQDTLDGLTDEFSCSFSDAIGLTIFVL